MNILLWETGFAPYKANIVKYEVGPSSIANGSFIPPKSLFPKMFDSDVGQRQITLRLDFVGTDENDAVTMMSSLTALFRQGVDIKLPDNYFYFCTLDRIGKAFQVAPWIVQQTFTLSGFRHGPLKTHYLSTTGFITVDGNYDTEAIFEISTADLSVTVNGITINNIGGNIVIDGMAKTVTQNGINKFKDTNLTEFPRLKPGVNQITIIGDAITVTVKYYPIYL